MKTSLLLLIILTLFVRTNSFACDGLTPVVSSNSYIGNGQYLLTIEFCEEVSNGSFFNGNLLSNANIFGLIFTVNGASIIGIVTPSITGVNSGVTVFPTQISTNQVEYGDWGNQSMPILLAYGDPQECWTVQFIVNNPATSVNVGGSTYVGASQPGSGMVNSGGLWHCSEVITVPPATCNSSWTPPTICLGSTTPIDLDNTTLANGVFSGPGVNSATGVFTPSGLPGPVSITLTVGDAFFNCATTHIITPVSLIPPNLTNQTICPGASVNLNATVTIAGGCNYTLVLTDSYGDGWNGADVDIYINGVLYLANQTVANCGSAPCTNTISLPVTNGAVILLNYTGGTWDNENTITLYNSNMVQVSTINNPPDGNLGAGVVANCPNMPLTYSWAPPAGLSNANIANPVATPAVTTTYNVTVSSASLGCSTTTPVTITVTPSITPTFNAVAPICAGAALSALPTTSTNGINGTWSPALNNMATTTYTFTPAAGQCAATTTLTITVNLAVTPTFAAVAPICSGAVLTALPTTSTNGINGTWSPALTNTATTTYTFTPTAGQCATTTTLTITVNTNVTPTFVAVAPICSGEVLTALPTTSTNGINGTWSPALNNTATTTYTFTPNAGQCATTTTLTITVNQPVTPTFTAVAPICSGTALAALPTTSNNGINGTWAPALNNTATTTYTFTPNAGQCATTTTLTITVNPPVTPTFTAVAPICSGAALAALPTTSNDGYTGTWAPALNNTATTTYTFTPNAGQCATTTTLTISVGPPTTPTFTAVAPICSGTALAALPTTSNDGFTGTWAPALNNTATTTYTFTPNAGQCATTTTLTISVVPPTTPTFTAVAPICSGTALAALPTTSDNGFTGTWAPALNNTATTTYTFTPNAGQCATTTTITITVNPLITPIFTAVAPICSGTALAALPTTSNNGINGAWAPALNNTATTTYTFTPNAGQCATTTTLTITVDPIVTPTFAVVAPICVGAALAALPTISTNGINGTWSPALDNTTTTTYTFTPTAGQCATTTTLTISVGPPATPTFTAVAPICSGDILAALPNMSNNGFDGTWSPAINNTTTTLYTYTPTAGQCAVTTTLTITVNQIVIPTFAAVAPICSGAAVAALPTISTNGINGTWSPAINNTATTLYTFTPAAGQCATTTTLTITVNPIFTSVQNVNLCPGSNYTYPDGTTSVNILVNETYISQLTNALGCDSIITTNITIDPIQPANAGNDVFICDGEFVTLLATTVAGSTIVWTGGVVNGVPFAPVSTQVYTVTVTNGSGCQSSDDVTVTVSPNPVASFTGDNLFGCDPHTVTFTNTSIGGPFNNCSWNFGNGNTAVGCGPITYTYDQAGLYTVSLTVTNNLGCSASAQIVDYIEVAPQPNAAFLPSTFQLDILNTEVTFDNNSTNADHYTWDFGDQSATSTAVNPTHTYLDILGYVITLTAFSDAGCSDTTTLIIPANDVLIYYIPNAFTPDDDAYNQVFQPVFTSGYDPYDFSLYIYNRWGEIIWESHDTSVGWDGTYGGDLVQDGIYTWKIEFKTTMNDERIMNVGHVNVIR